MFQKAFIGNVISNIYVDRDALVWQVFRKFIFIIHN
jgi:hypothetical protein